MILFLCCVLPSVWGLWMFEAFSKRDLTLKQCIYRGSTYVLISNLLCFAVKKWILQTAANPLTVNGDMSASTALNYLIIVLPVVVVMVVSDLLFSKKVKVSVEDTSDEGK
ncbi:MAG: hypothetical protein II348_03315 [Clostridia bacterium]|nr:hypothetical protein [Clostridia bacterium]